jgi:hypothetical protein
MERTAEEKIETDRAQLFEACHVDHKNKPDACQKALAALYKAYLF